MASIANRNLALNDNVDGIIGGRLLKLILVSRTYCHLCQEMEVEIAPLLEEYGVEVDVVDVDSDPLLEEKYGEFVPVLLDGKTELCRFRLDISKVRDYLGEIR